MHSHLRLYTSYLLYSLFDKLIPENFTCWLRTMLALRLADNGKDWTDIFKKYNYP